MLSRKLSDVDIINVFKQIDEEPQRKKELYEDLVKKLSYIPCSLVAKYRRYGNYLDLKQTAYLTFFKAMSTFDYNKSSNFKGWSWWWVRKEVAKEAYREKLYLASFADLNIEEIEVMFTYNIEESFIELEQAKIVEELLGKLDDRSRAILEKSFGVQNLPPESLREIADGLGLSHESVRKIRNTAIQKLATLYSKTQ